jgi:hypothetical protein
VGSVEVLPAGSRIGRRLGAEGATDEGSVDHLEQLRRDPFEVVPGDLDAARLCAYALLKRQHIEIGSGAAVSQKSPQSTHRRSAASG